MRKEAQLLCDVCKRPQKGFFFSCREHSCYFWIHKDCAVLPRVIETTVDDHHLLFSYSLFGTVYPRRKKGRHKCLICSEKFIGTAAYYCQLCGFTCHSDCAISKTKNSGYDPPVQFPLEEADKSLFICEMLYKKRKGEKNNEEDGKLSIEIYHNHPLIFHDIVDEDSSSNSLCDACVLPIHSPPYYSCEKPGCDFSLHQHCTNLPLAIDPGFQAERYILTLKSDELLLRSFSKYPISLFGCRHSHLWNGFGYRLYPFANDLECSSAPRTIRHQLHHTQHILYLILVRFDEIASFHCCSSGKYDYSTGYAYKCVSCNFNIHIRCAFLPAKVSHRFDKHPLQLSSGTNVDGEYSFCEICEHHVDTKYWFYHCKDCDQSFHVNCLPSVGLLSKIKFGGSFVVPRHREDHPVTFTRMLEIGSQRCWECKDVIQGFVDAMAFQCSECSYWFHFDCAFSKDYSLLKRRMGYD